DPVVDAVLRRDLAGEQRRAGRGTNRRGAVELVQPRTLGGEPVEIGRDDLVVAGAPQRPWPLVVRQDDDDIGTVSLHEPRASCVSRNERPARSPVSSLGGVTPDVCTAIDVKMAGSSADPVGQST